MYKYFAENTLIMMMIMIRRLIMMMMKMMTAFSIYWWGFSTHSRSVCMGKHVEANCAPEMRDGVWMESGSALIAVKDYAWLARISTALCQEWMRMVAVSLSLDHWGPLIDRTGQYRTTPCVFCVACPGKAKLTADRKLFEKCHQPLMK